MKLKITDELREILSKIKGKQLDEAQWAEIESSDMFQSEHYCGGFDADENEFCFSFWDESRVEYWFQFSLEDVNKALSDSHYYFLVTEVIK